MKAFFLCIALCVRALAHEGELPTANPDQIQAMVIAKKFCGACHAIEPERFIVSDDPAVNWKFIHENGPQPGMTWAEAMRQVLDWPNADPKFLKDPPAPKPRWMPVGQKRYAMTQEKIDHRNAREFLLEILVKGETP